MDPRPTFAIVLADPEGVETHHVFTEPHIVVGRQAGSDLVLRDVTVSRKHCSFEWQQSPGAPPELHVADLGSNCGVFCNGHRISGSTVVRHSDKLLIGAVIVRIEIGG